MVAKCVKGDTIPVKLENIHKAKRTTASVASTVAFVIIDAPKITTSAHAQVVYKGFNTHTSTCNPLTQSKGRHRIIYIYIYQLLKSYSCCAGNPNYYRPLYLGLVIMFSYYKRRQ